MGWRFRSLILVVGWNLFIEPWRSQAPTLVPHLLLILALPGYGEDIDPWPTTYLDGMPYTICLQVLDLRLLRFGAGQLANFFVRKKFNHCFYPFQPVVRLRSR